MGLHKSWSKAAWPACILVFYADGSCYGFRFNALLENGADLKTAVNALYEDAEAQYGDPDTYEGMNNRISENLESMDNVSDSFTETWSVSEQTELTWRIDLIGDKVLLQLSYEKN